MKQLYYVNGKKVDFNTYANALNAEITAEETRKEYEVKIKGFIEYINKNPSVLEKWNNTSFSPESIIKILFILAIYVQELFFFTFLSSI